LLSSKTQISRDKFKSHLGKPQNNT
jgi:hypothetical protein